MLRVVPLFALLAGCLIFDDPPPPPCQYGAPGFAAQQLRDPNTGICQDQSYPCDPTCGQPCPATGAGAANPDWATCNGACEGLTETQCLATPSCHAAYQDAPSPSPVFWGCWDLPPSGVMHGSCTGLDAQTCSEHDDCTSLYTSPVNQGPNFVPSFERCNPEPNVTCDTIDCGTGNVCVVTPTSSAIQCEPVATAGTCGGLSCQMAPPACPASTTPGIDTNGCYTGYCIPTSECTQPLCSTLATESACKARSDCNTIYNGTNCTCDVHGCTCQTETFVRCQ